MDGILTKSIKAEGLFSAKIRLNHQNLVHIMYFLIFFRDVFFRFTNISDVVGSDFSKFCEDGCFWTFLLLAVFVFLCFQKLLIVEFMKVVVIIGITAISAFASGYTILLEGVILIVCSKDIDFEELVYFVLKLQVIAGLVIALLALSGCIDMGTVSRTIDRAYDETSRYALGFSHPNKFGIYIFQICCEIFYLNRKKLAWSIIFNCFVLILFTFILTNGYTALVMSMLFIVMLIAYKIFHFEKKEKKRKIRRFIIAFSIVLLVISFKIIYDFMNNPNYYVHMFSALSTVRARYNAVRKYLNAYGINFLGNRIATGYSIVIPGYSVGNYWLDCGYAALFIRDGILFAGLFLGGLLLLFKQKIKEGNWALLIILCTYTAYFLMENSPLNLGFNIFLIWMADLLFSGKKRTA